MVSALPNYFQVDESEINCTPATNYVAHDVSCNLLNNYGEDLISFGTSLHSVGSSSSRCWSINPSQETQTGSKLAQVVSLHCTSTTDPPSLHRIEGDNMESSVQPLEHPQSKRYLGQLIGASCRVTLDLGFIAGICGLRLQAIREYTDEGCC
jgi:hypothetical protein